MTHVQRLSLLACAIFVTACGSKQFEGSSSSSSQQSVSSTGDVVTPPPANIPPNSSSPNLSDIPNQCPSDPTSLQIGIGFKLTGNVCLALSSDSSRLPPLAWFYNSDPHCEAFMDFAMRKIYGPACPPAYSLYKINAKFVVLGLVQFIARSAAAPPATPAAGVSLLNTTLAGQAAVNGVLIEAPAQNPVCN